MSASVAASIDHFAWIVSPENQDRYRRQLDELFGIKLLKHPEPRSFGPESSIYISSVGGFELLSPKGDQTPLVRQYSAELASKGEFPTFCVMRVPDHEWAAERIEAAAYADRVGRLDRIGWVVEPDSVGERVKLLEALFVIAFERDETAAADVESWVSWEGGLEFLAPTDASSELAAEQSARLADRGEGLYSTTFAVEDLAATVAKARDLGLAPDDDVACRSGADEARLDDCIGMKLTASQPAGARARVAA